MLDWTQLALAWGLSLVLTLTVTAILRRPLYAVLQVVCGNDISARFWTLYSSVMMVVGPLFVVSLGAIGNTSSADFARRIMVLSSLGLIAAVIIMGLAVRSAVRPEAIATPAPEVA
jgi:hypothetical protein